MTSWKQVLKERGIDLDAIGFSSRVENDGCVIRALSSAAGVPATKQDYQERFAQIDRQHATDIDYISQLMSRNHPATTLGRKLVERDFSHLRKLPQKLHSRGTELGEKLHTMNIRQAKLSPRQIMEQIAAGHKVIGVFHIQDGDTIQTHAAHLGVQDGNIRFLSDEGHPKLDTSKNISVNTLVLKKS